MMKKQPTVSVIVPIYNGKEYLKRCVDSLTGQTFQDIEIVLVNDGSTDESGALCDVFAGADDRIKVVHKENGGLISAWKRGVEESCGQYLCFVDCDDWIDLCMIEEMLKKVSGTGKEIISCDYVIERENGGEAVYQELAPGSYTREKLEIEVFPALLGNERRKVCFSRCMKLITRSLIEENSRYSDPAVRMGEDVTVMLPAILDCDRLVIMEHKTYYHYYYNRESMVHKYDPGMFANINLLKQIMEQVLKEKLTEDSRSSLLVQAEKEYIYLLMLVIKDEARGNQKNCRTNIQKICVANQEIRELLRRVPVEVKETSGRLIYRVMKHPNYFNIALLTFAMKVYYGK